MESRIGFGIGAYHSLFSKKMVNTIFGLEVNYTNILQGYKNAGHFHEEYDITGSQGRLTVPLFLRLNLGSNGKFFIEAGGYYELIFSEYNGTMHSFIPGEQDYKSSSGGEFSELLGFQVELGFRIPISKYALIIKPDYRFHLNNSITMDSDYQTAYKYLRLTLGLRIN